MSNRPSKPMNSHQLNRLLALTVRDLLAALDAVMREQRCPDGWCQVRNRARALLRETPNQGEP